MKVEIQFPGEPWTSIGGVAPKPTGYDRWQMDIPCPQTMRARELDQIKIRIDGVEGQNIVAITGAKNPGDTVKITFEL